ncbi:MAG TPA: hypothetical protein VLC55_13035 [Burkholderiales bacterium]|nr:hypothetical protein [Burkholderiales bacterium]
MVIFVVTVRSPHFAREAVASDAGCAPGAFAQGLTEGQAIEWSLARASFRDVLVVGTAAAEAQALIQGLPASDVAVRGALFLPSGGGLARWIEPRLGDQRPDCGSFVAIAASRAGWSRGRMRRHGGRITHAPSPVRATRAGLPQLISRPVE